MKKARQRRSGLHIFCARSMGRYSGLEVAARYVAMLCDSLLAETAADVAHDLENAARRRSFDEVSMAFETLEDELEVVLEDLANAVANTR